MWIVVVVSALHEDHPLFAPTPSLKFIILFFLLTNLDLQIQTSKLLVLNMYFLLFNLIRDCDVNPIMIFLHNHFSLWHEKLARVCHRWEPSFYGLVQWHVQWWIQNSGDTNAYTVGSLAHKLLHLCLYIVHKLLKKCLIGHWIVHFCV